MVVGLLVASMVFSARHVSEHASMSPIDEFVYSDYYAKVLDHGVVRQGEKTGLFARRTMSCDGIRVAGPPPNQKACGQRNAGGEIYPLGGLTSADIYTPAYFLITRVAAQPFVWAGVGFLDAGRLVGGLWLAAAVILLYVALRRRGVAPAVAGGSCLVLAGSLPAYWAHTYISTDATALLAGAAMFLLAMEARRSRTLPLVLLVVAAGVFTLFKVQNLAAVAAAAIYLVLLAAYDARSAGSFAARLRAWLLDRRLLAAVSAVVVGVACQAAWLAVRAALAVGEVADHGVGLPFEPRYLFTDAFVFLPNVAAGALAPAVAGPYGDSVYVLTVMVIIGGGVGLLLARSSEAYDRLLALAGLLGCLLAGPALSLAIVVTTGQYVSLPPRYGMSLVPWLVGCFALLVDGRTRTAQVATVAFGALVWSLSLLLAEA
ncbi:hypothetical protein DDE18_18165 [Nocardioides gansuensis]|uniref:Glycosyltransferase RgtA/B/C/D-like domain-containing protein n=1 Tax=Nocardioides gansuensis TaxID=2138300 RepID=A0A2T8F6S7_9ACTN|nr:hypothetical protein DDE18_18165 [Nocardioides gansuensis]